MEKYLTPKQIAEKAGFFKPEDIRAACRRGKDYNPLPCVKKGDIRPRFYIRWSAFESWLEREEQF